MITAVDHQVYPDYRMFGIGENPAGFGEQPPTPAGGWLGAGHAGVRIGVGEDLIETTLRVEHWDGEPPAAPPDHDVQESIRLYLPTGQLNPDEITAGARDLGLAVSPGEYDVRITGWRRGGAPQHYLAQFWLRTPAPALLRSIGCLIHAGYDRIAIVDEGATIRAVPPIGPQWFAVHDALVQFRYEQDRPTLRLELWAGLPPIWWGAPEPIALRLPTGRLHMLHLPPGEAGIAEINNGRIPLETLPPSDYNLSLSNVGPNFLAQLWPAPETT